MLQCSKFFLKDKFMPEFSENVMEMASNLGIKFPTQLPLFRGAPNLEHLNDWVESQSTPMTRKIAHKIAANLQYISFEDFLKQLQQTINGFHQQVNNSPYVLIVGELRPEKLARGCSDQWIIGLALEYCGLKEPEAILTYEQLATYRKAHPTLTHILMLDDAAYSGVQKSGVLEYFSDQINTNELSFYVGIPYMTHYAKKSLSRHSATFKELIFLNQVSMPSIIDALDENEIFYAEQTHIGFINKRHTLTYFDHRFADFYSCFQQIYNGSNLLTDSTTSMMHFSGYSFDPKHTNRNKNLKLITESSEYNNLAISWFEPNNGVNCSGFAIPTIIPPYQIHHYKTREKLNTAIKHGKVGSRSPYPTIDLKIDALLSKSNSQCMPFFKYKKSTCPHEKQVGYDRAVMLGNQDEITYDEQVGRHKKQQALLHEIKTSFPILKPRRIEPHSFLQLLSNFVTSLLNIFMLISGLRLFVRMIQESIYPITPSEHINTNSP